MADITTKAGLAMAGTLSTFTGPRDAIDSLIAAIEAEAVRAERARLAAAVRGMGWDSCGGWGCDENMGAVIGDVLALLEGEG